MTNYEKYTAQCWTCAFAPIGETMTECNAQHICALCGCYNKEKSTCHCHDEADDGTKCKYYKENGR